MRQTVLCFGLVWAAFSLPAAFAAQDEVPQETPLDSPFLAEPKTPAELFDAARIAVRLARPKLARTYLEKLLEEADDATLLELRTEFGPGEFLRLATNQNLHPTSRTLLQRINAAFRDQTEDPERIVELVKSLSGTASERAVGIESLRAGGPRVVGPMLNILADSGQATLHNQVTIALTELSRDAVPAIRAAIDSPDVRVRSASIVALGYLNDRSVVPYLWHPAFAPDQPAGVRAAARKTLQQLLAGAPDRPRRITNIGAANQLYDEALTYFNGSHKWQTDDEGNVVAWQWLGNNVSGVPTKATAASQSTGARLAKDAMALAPNDLEKQALYLAFALAADSKAAGWNNPLPIGNGTAQNLGLAVGGDLLRLALEVSLDHDNTYAARGALAAIWQVGGNDLLRATTSANHSPLMRALSHPNPRVQFAAANAILNLTPDADFPGSSQVIAVLSRALYTSSAVQCLVIDPSIDRANTLANLITNLDYGAQVASTGRQGFRTAAGRGDVGLIAIHANVSNWALSETIANLRADTRTSGIPIVITGPPFTQKNVAYLLSQHTDVTWLEESAEGTDAYQKIVEISLKPFLDRTVPKLNPEELVAQKQIAADWFAQLAGPRRKSPIDFSSAQAALQRGAKEEAISRQCINGLGAIATAGSQLELQRLAIDEGLPETTRADAINELAFHIQRNSNMLGVAEQLDVIKLAQALANTPLSTAAAALAGSMKPSARRTFERLRDYRPSQP